MILSILKHNNNNVGGAMLRGERKRNRTKSAVKGALLELIREKNYPAITVGAITERANVGRSTLYRHYQSKADVLIDIHRDEFESLFSDLTTACAWVAPEPPACLILFFKKFQRLGRNPFSLTYKLGRDLDYLVANINLQLSISVESRLRTSFTEAELSVPLSVLAQSVAGVYSSLIISAFTRFQSYHAHQFATYIHRLTGAMVRDAQRKNRRV